MARVFTTVQGDVVRIDGYGEASNDVPALVPETVADELEADMKGELADPEIPGHRGRPAHDRFRIERGEAPAPGAGNPSEAGEAVATGSQGGSERARGRGRREREE